jgi:hypothetical protein
MKRTITSVPQIYRNVRRWTEIVSVLSKYGLADWLSRFNVDFITDLLRTSAGETQSQLTQSARIRLAFTELGPTFIKFGQLLSTRPDLIGNELADELAKLQSNAPFDDFETIKENYRRRPRSPARGDLCRVRPRTDRVGFYWSSPSGPHPFDARRQWPLAERFKTRTGYPARANRCEPAL